MTPRRIILDVAIVDKGLEMTSHPQTVPAGHGDSVRVRLGRGVALAVLAGWLWSMPSAQAQPVPEQGWERPATRQSVGRGQSVIRPQAGARGVEGLSRGRLGPVGAGQAPAARAAPAQAAPSRTEPRGVFSPAMRAGPVSNPAHPDPVRQTSPGQVLPDRPGRVDTGRFEGGRPARPSRYPGREPYRGGGGWGPAAAGIGAGIIGGILLDQATRRPVYDPYEPDLPRRTRRPVVIEAYEQDEPLVRRPRPSPERAAPPPRRSAPPRTAGRPPSQPRVVVPPLAEQRLVADEILFELAPGADADAVLRRHRATLVTIRRFDLPGVTIIRARLNDGRSARTVLAQMAGDRRVASAQPNYVYSLQQDETAQQPAADASVPGLAVALPAAEAPVGTAVPEPKPALPPQYVVETLRLEDLHRLARGTDIRVAVIDSGADQTHPELRGIVAGSFDALDAPGHPHAHGTAMAAAILAQAQLQGVAPAARLLAARAFSGGALPASASGTSFHILSALDWAAGQGARVLNLSFAGPQDRLLSRALAGARGKGMVAVAAAGNGGPSAAPLYPGADPNVIAVTATDAADKPFDGASRGAYIAVAAPGVDVLAAEPEGRYAFSSGTSIAAAHVSGLVALLLEKRPDLDLDGVRRLLMESAVDLGTKGRDPIFGAGRIDAPAALARALPVSAARP